MTGADPRLTILGSSSGVPTPTRGNSGLTLSLAGRHYLFDAGEPLTQGLLRAGIDPVGLTAVFLTHLHADHIGGLPQLIQSLQIRARHQALPLYLPAEGRQPLLDFLEAIYLSPDLLPFELQLHGAPPGPLYDDGLLRVTAVANQHLAGLRLRIRDADQRHPGWALESRSFIVETGPHQLIVGGDLRSADELTPWLPKATALVCELVHFPPETLYPVLATGARLRDVVLTHFHPNVEQRAEAIMTEVRRRLPSGARVHWAADGLAIGLLPATPTLL